MKTSVKLIHARLHAQALTMAALVGSGLVEYYDHKYGSSEPKIYGDLEAADMVFTSGVDIVVVGINITTQVCFTDEDLLELKNSKGNHAQFLCDMCKFNRD